MGGTAIIEATLCGDYDCEVPLSNGYTICADHTHELSRALNRVPEVWANLQVTISRQDATAASIGGGATGSRPCINLDAHDKGETLTHILNGWAAMLNNMRSRTLPPAAADYLAAQLDHIAREEWAGELLAELSESLRTCTRATDRAADRISLGVCGYAECPGAITAIIGAHAARCRECGLVWDVNERQQVAISNAWHTTGSLRLMVAALRAGKYITTSYETVRKWAQRDKLYGRCDIATRETIYTVADIYNSCVFPSPHVTTTKAA